MLTETVTLPVAERAPALSFADQYRAESASVATLAYLLTGDRHLVCVTAFFFDDTSQRLVAFTTSSPKYATAHGTSVGTSQSDAEQREGVAAWTQGCYGGTLGLGLSVNLQFTAPTGIILYFGSAASNPSVSQIQAVAKGDPLGMLSC